MSKITLNDVNNEALETIRLLRTGAIDVRQATAVKGLLDTVVDTAKVQVEFIKTLSPETRQDLDEIKVIAGTLRNPDAEMDKALKEVDERNKQPYQFSK